MRRGKYNQSLENMSNEEWLYHTFEENCKNAVYQKNSLFFPDIGLKLQLNVAYTQEQRIQTLFVFTHPDFFEPMIELLQGYGENPLEQLQTIAYTALHSVISVLLHSLRHTSKQILSAHFLQKPHKFHVYHGNLFLTGDFREFQIKELWELYKEDILKRLGTKNIYWIKLYASYTDFNAHCEIRINGEIILELTEKLKEYTASWNLDGFHSAEQIVMLVQSPETRILCSYTSTEVKKYTYEAIHLFEAGIDYNSIYHKLLYIVKDESLTSELFYLIPELYCGIVFSDIPIEEGFYLYNTNTHFVYPSQLRSYRHIEETLFEHFRNDSPSKEQIINTVSVSARLKALNSAIEKGSQLKDIQMSSFLIPMSGTYIIR